MLTAKPKEGGINDVYAHGPTKHFDSLRLHAGADEYRAGGPGNYSVPESIGEGDATMNGPLLKNGYTEKEAMLIDAMCFVLEHLDPNLDEHPKRQHVLYSDALHPTDDSKTVVDYLKDVLNKVQTTKRIR